MKTMNKRKFGKMSLIGLSLLSVWLGGCSNSATKVKETSQLSPMEMIVMTAQAIIKIEQKQDEQDKRLAEIESKTTAVLDGHGFYSILGYCKRKGIKLDAKESAKYGKLAVSESKAQGIMIGSVPDARYGSVHTYSQDVLDFIFSDKLDVN